MARLLREKNVGKRGSLMKKPGNQRRASACSHEMNISHEINRLKFWRLDFFREFQKQIHAVASRGYTPQVFGVYPYENMLFYPALPLYTEATRFKETKRLMACPHQKKSKNDKKGGQSASLFALYCFAVSRPR